MTSSPNEDKKEVVLDKEKSLQDLPKDVPPNTDGKEQKNKSLEEDENFKAFREGRKKDRAEKEAAEKKAIEKEAEISALKAAMEAAFTKQPQVNNQNYSYPDNAVEENEDERIEKKVNAIIAQREASYEKSRIQREMEEYPLKLQQTYPDFEKVISQENRDYLDYHYPEISRPLSRLSEGFDKWSDIYHTIKKLVPNSTTAKKESAKADINQNKPRSMSSTGITQPQTSPGTNILSEERKMSNWERMRRTMNGIS